ncbi:MFS transporter [Nonomuraea sp. NPDC004580]|uniref:MFS transporter n=1 Tax=Nonomuraea sp. NPDC004580 TaxID=3154552 RepID=UPI0033A57773
MAIPVLAFAVAVGSLQMTVVVPLLPGLERLLHAPPTTVSWALTAGMLSGAVSIPLLARLGDMYGRRTMALLTLALLAAGSVLSAVADALPLLLAGRVLQGTAAPLLPLSMGLVRQLVPPDRLPAAIGVLSATLGAGCGGGLIMAGLLDGDHRAVFWAQAALAALSLLLVAAVVRESHARAPGRPDLAGAALVALWLGSLLLAVSKGAAWGWTSPATLGLFAAAVAGAAVWVVTARRTPQPLIEIPMLLHRATVGATVASFLMGLALFTAITTVSAVAQGRLGASVLQVGLYLLPTTLLMLVTSVLAGPLMRRYTASTLVAAGSALVSASALWLALSGSSPMDLYGAATVLGLGTGLGYAALGTMAVEHVEPAKTAAAGGINALVRIAGSSVAGAVGAAVLDAGGPAWTFGVAAAAGLLAALFATAHTHLTRTPTREMEPV